METPTQPRSDNMFEPRPNDDNESRRDALVARPNDKNPTRPNDESQRPVTDESRRDASTRLVPEYSGTGVAHPNEEEMIPEQETKKRRKY